MLQIRAAVQKPNWLEVRLLSQLTTMRRHVSMRSAYVRSTTTTDAASTGQSASIVSGWPLNSCHCLTSAFPTYQRTTAVTASWPTSQSLLRRARGGGLIDVGVALGNRLGGEGGEGVEASSGTQRRAAIRAVEERGDCCRESRGVDGLYED